MRVSGTGVETSGRQVSSLARSLESAGELCHSQQPSAPEPATPCHSRLSSATTEARGSLEPCAGEERERGREPKQGAQHISAAASEPGCRGGLELGSFAFLLCFLGFETSDPHCALGDFGVWESMGAAVLPWFKVLCVHALFITS